jgi:hypothetical protein
MVAEASKWPKEFKINDRLKARIGYKNSRFEVEYDTRIPFVRWYTLALQPADLPLIDSVFDAQDKWVALSKAKGGKAVLELPISAQVKAKIGFEDRHVEILVSVLVTNYVITLKESEAPVVRAALAEARRWDKLPDSEKQKGAA